jgi:HlyD family secretion protein
VEFPVASKNLIASKRMKTGLIAVLGIVAVVAIAAQMRAQESARPSEPPEDRGWQAVAPGRVEPWSGEIKIAAAVVGRIGEVLVGVNDKVFAGEPLIRLEDSEARARVATAEAQIALRKRARNDQSTSSRAAERRRAEDWVADAEHGVFDAQSAVDQAAIAKRAGRGSDTDLTAARAGMSREQDRLKQRQSELRTLEDDKNTPLPTLNEGQLNVARAELLLAQAGIEKLTIRAPMAGTVLQVNAKPGELAAPAAGQPLLLIGDISALRVRAELDERDFGEIKVGQPALVRAPAFRGREFPGKVSSVAPLVDAGRINARDQRGLTDVRVVEVLVDLAEGSPLAVGMKVDVYFRHDGPARQ